MYSYSSFFCRTCVLVSVFLSAVSAAETATVYRDDFGIPHIYAESAEAGMYASGWAMAEDRLVQTLENFLRGMGRFSEAYGVGEGDANVRADLESLMWDHYGVSKKHYDNLPKPFRNHNAAFIDGINAYMKAHPEDVPDWWTGEADVYMPVAFSRQFIWSWPAGQAAGDLRKVDLRPNYDVDFRSSNEMAVAPARTAFGSAMLVIDPHLGWFGRQRYWEVRIHAGDIHISGFATAGFPYVNLGHNNHVAWAHTTGGPDTGDVYELTLNPDNPMQYRYDDEWRDLTTKSVTYRVKDEMAAREHTFYYSHHGPIIARNENKAYAAALAYADEIGYLESKYLFMIARDYAEVKTALEVRQIMPQNVMVADTKGNIYYQRTGRVPIRPDGFDFSAPVDGSTSKSEWLGVHPTSDLVQVLNPPQGYMQNCNITPDVMMVGSPMTPDKYPSYIFNQPAMYTHQRASRATELLHNNDNITVEDAIEIALDKKCYQYERWVSALETAFKRPEVREYVWKEGRPDIKPGVWRDIKRGLRRLRRWDGYQTLDSNGALIYYYWKRDLLDLWGSDSMQMWTGRINNYLDVFGEPENDEEPNDVDYYTFADSFRRALEEMRERHGDLNATFGDVFRAGRLDYDGDDVSYPVGGGSLRYEGMATVRAIGFTEERDDHTRWGRSGQTSTQVVILSDPIQSFSQPPIGQSDHPDSPHFRDQAKKLLSKSKMKSAWFHKDDLLRGHVRSSYALEYVGR